MAVSSSSASKNKAESEKEMKRAKNPGVRVVGGRVYDSKNGKTCHQCRQKTMDFVASCKNLKQEKQCTIKFCHKCLLNRYGEKAEEVALLDDWKCPKCRGICNCSFCMKKRGHKPTGALVQAAKATGFSCVSEMLQVKGPEIVKDIVASPKKLDVSKKESMAASPRKPGKENSLDGNCDSSLNLRNVTPISNEKKSKKTKREGLKEICNGNMDDDAALKKSNPKKPKVSSRDELNRKEKNGGGFVEKKTDSLGHVKKEEINGAEIENAGVSNGVNNDDGGAKLKAAIVSRKVKKSTTEFQNKEFNPDIQLPQGSSSVTVAGIELLPEDVGNALQFLEFCAAFGEVLGMKKGQAESVIRELMCQRRQTRHPVQYSSNVELHIQLLSLIQKDKGEPSPSSSPTAEESSWLQALGKCISESQCQLKEFPFDCFSKGGYDKLDTLKKLKLLNFLCDEALCTTDLRNWIDNQNSKFAEREKEAKVKVIAAKDKEKRLKQKLQDEVAKAILAKNGAPLSVSEHGALVSEIKSEAAQAHAEMLEAMGMVPKKKQRSDAVRTEPIMLDNGHAFWRLKSHPGEPNILLQDMGTWDGVSHNEKWFAYNAEQKQEIEKYFSCLRVKRLRAQKVIGTPSIACTETNS